MTPIETVKLELVLFGRDGVIRRRLLTQTGPVRDQKRSVRTFEVEGECTAIGFDSRQ